MDLEQRALRFVEDMQSIYFERRDIDQVIEALDQDVILFGFGSEEIRLGREETQAWLLSEKAAYTGSFRILESWYDALKTGEHTCLVAGRLQVQESALPISLDVRVFVLCRETPEGMRMSRIHMSLPSSGQAEGEFFPCRLTADANRLLERLVKEKSAELEKHNRNMQMLMRNIPGGIFRCLYDENLTILQMSDGFLSLFGYTREEIHSQFQDSFWRMIDPRDRETFLADIRRQLSGGNTSKIIEYRVICRDGSSMWVLDKGQLLPGEEGGLSSFYCVLVDVTRGREAQEALRLSLDRYQIVMDQTNDIIIEWDIEQDTMEYSPNWEKKFGYQPLQTAVSKSILNNSHILPEDQNTFLDMLGRLKRGDHYVEAEIRLRQKEGSYIWCRIRFTAQKDAAGKPVKAVGVIIDIDREKRSVQKLLEQAQRDTLTKLYNKGTSEKLIEEMLPSGEEISALLIIDIDDFKLVNDTMGHLFGDAFLMETANEIRMRFRQMDVVGRIGGDEFIAFIRNIPSMDLVKKKAGQIVGSVRELAGRNGLSERVSCSIGIAVAPDHGQSFQTLYRRADHALYHAKKQGKNRYAVYDGAVMGNVMEGMPQISHTAIGAAIDSDAGLSLVNRLVEYILRVLYQTQNVDKAVNSILEIVGRQFDVSRAYIFENTEDDRFCNNTFEWCSDGVQPEKDHLQHISYEKDLGGSYLDNFNEDGIFYCQDVSELNPEQYSILEPQGIKSMLQCAIWDNGRFRGYVGFDDCRTNRFWNQDQVDALGFISKILSIFLLKQRAQERMEQSVNAMKTVLDHQNAWIYVIRPDTYEILYINHKTMSLAPHGRVGMPCYKAYFHRETPCETCPARTARRQDGNVTMEIYNPVLKVWSAADASQIIWKGEEAILLTCHDITRYKEGERESD